MSSHSASPDSTPSKKPYPAAMEQFLSRHLNARILVESITEFFADNCFRFSAALAYYTLLSLPPILLIVVYVAALFVGQDTIEGPFYQEIARIFSPDFAKILYDGLTAVRTSERQGLGATLSFLSFLLSATGVFVELQSALNTIWGAKAKPTQAGWWAWLRSRLLSLSIIFAVGFVLLVSLVLSTVVQLLLQYILPRLHGRLSEHDVWISIAINNSVFWLLAAFIFALIFKVLPDCKVKWRYAMIGGLITSALFMFGKYVFVNFLSGSTLTSAYGAAGSVIAMMIWVYYSGLILFFGAELTQKMDEYRQPKPLSSR